MTDPVPPAVLPRALRAAAPLYVGLGVTYAAAFALKALLVGWAFRGPEDMARFETLDRALQWLVTLSLLGMPAAVLRIGPERPERQADLLRTAGALSLFVWAAGCAAILAVPGLHDVLIGHASRAPFAAYCVRGLFVVFLALAAATLHAQGRLRGRALLESADKVLALALVVALLSIEALGGVWVAILGSVLSAAFACLLVFHLLPALRQPRHVADAAALMRDLIRVGRPQLAISLLEALRPLALLRVAAEFSNGRETGLLATAAAFSLPLIAVPEMAAQALFPGMAGPQGEHAHVEGERRRLLREMLVAGLPLLALYGAAAAWLLPYAKGGQYSDAVPALLALLPGVLAHGLTAHAGYVLLVRDRLTAAARASAVALGATVAFAALLVPRWGATGGAAALSAALVLRAVMLLTSARRA